MSSSPDVVGILTSKFPGKVEKLELTPPQDAVTVDVSTVREVFRFLKDSDELKIDYLNSLSGVDTGESLEAVYHMSSLTTKVKLTIKVKLDYEKPCIDSICDIYRAADWFEREMWELYGFDVKGHPDLRPLLLPEDWDQGHPMRKGWTGRDFIIKPEV